MPAFQERRKRSKAVPQLPYPETAAASHVSPSSEESLPGLQIIAFNWRRLYKGHNGKEMSSKDRATEETGRQRKASVRDLPGPYHPLWAPHPPIYCEAVKL